METTSGVLRSRRWWHRLARPTCWVALAGAIVALTLFGIASAADVPVATVPVGDRPAVVAVDPLSHQVYVGNYYGDSVTVIDGVARSSLATVPMPTGASIAVPIAATVDVLSGKAYVGNFWSNYVSVIDGATLSKVATISPPASHGSGVRAIAADPSGATPKIYAAVFGKNVVSVIDGSTDTIVKNIPVGSSPRAIAIFASGSRRRVYVANRYGNNVSIIDGNTDSVVATAPTGAEPKVIAVDPNRGFAYVSSPASDTITVVDDSDQVTATISVGDNPIGVAVDPAGRRVFVANYASNSVSVIDADTLSVVATVATGVQPMAIAVDRSSRKAYVSCYGSSSVTMIDSSLAAASIATGYRPYALGIDEALASHQVYSANWGADNVTVIDPPGGDAGSVTVAIDPLSGDTTSSTSPVFSGTASSYRAPRQSNIVAVFYRIDADQIWHRAQIVAGAGSPSVRWQAVSAGPLSSAAHVIHIAAMDQALAVSSSSDQGAGGDSAALGGGATYQFAVATAPTVVDAGFESGTDGAALASPPWTIVGLAQHAEYDTARAMNGTTSAWLQGPVAAGSAGVAESDSAGMTSDGAELRFWLYADTTNEVRYLYDLGTTAQAFTIRLGGDGTLATYTNAPKSVTGYTPAAYTTLGTYQTGWTQVRIVFDFTGDTFTLSTRRSATDPWTQLKATGAADFAIPMRTTDNVTQSQTLRVAANRNAQIWLDDLTYSNTGIIDEAPPAATLVDAGFESGADAAALASPPWTIVGLAQHAEYDTARAMNGTTSAWLQGPVAAGSAGVAESDSAGMTSDGAELRFWLYADTTNEVRYLYDLGTTAQAFTIRLGGDGTLATYTNAPKSVTGYTPAAYTTLGTYQTGWTQVRIVFDFTGDTFTLSTRRSATDPWTQLKATGAADFAIPMRTTDNVTQSQTLRVAANRNAQIWLDDLTYSNTGIR